MGSPGSAPGTGLFRAEALEAANQPLEQLDQMMRLTPRRTWITVAGVVLVALAAAVWGVVAKTSVVVAGVGVVLPTNGLSEVFAATSGALSAHVFVPASKGQLIKAGARVDVAVDSAPSSQYGTIRGTVISVPLIPVSTQRLSFLAGNSDTITDILESTGPVLELEVDLEHADTASGYRWSAGHGPDFRLASGTILRPSVLLSRRSLVSRVFS